MVLHPMSLKRPYNTQPVTADSVNQNDIVNVLEECVRHLQSFT